MRILNVEDDAIKHVNICKVLKSCGVTEVDWAKNLEEGLDKSNNFEYDLCILDMWFPRRNGTNPAELGLEFIDEMKHRKSKMPILVCSSVKYNIQDVIKCAHYSDYSEWIEDICETVHMLSK